MQRTHLLHTDPITLHQSLQERGLRKSILQGKHHTVSNCKVTELLGCLLGQTVQLSKDAAFSTTYAAYCPACLFSVLDLLAISIP